MDGNNRANDINPVIDNNAQNLQNQQGQQNIQGQQNNPAPNNLVPTPEGIERYNRFLDAVRQKTEELKRLADGGLRGRGFYDKNAELIYYKTVIQKREAEIKSGNPAYEGTLNEFITGRPHHHNAPRIEEFQNRAWSVANKLQLPDGMMIPGEFEEKVSSGTQYNAWTEEQAEEDRQALYDQGKLDIFVGNPLGAGYNDNFKNAVIKACGFENERQAYPAYFAAFDYFKNTVQQEDTVNPPKKGMKTMMTNCGFATMNDRTPSQLGMFYLYLMGRKENSYTFNQIMEMHPGYNGPDGHVDAHPDFQKEMDAFLKFMEDTAITGPGLSADKAKTNTKEWVNIYINSSKKFGDYRFPDVDFNDKQAMKPHMKELFMMSKIAIEFGQQITCTLNANPAYTDDAMKGGREAIEKSCANMNNCIDRFTKSYALAYSFSSADYNKLENTRKKFVTGKASSKIAFGEEGNNVYRGKKVSDIANTKTVRSLYAENVSIIWDSYMEARPPYTHEQAMEFLKGNNKDEILPLAAEKRAEAVTQVVDESINKTRYEEISHVPGKINGANYQNLVRLCGTVFAKGRTGQQIKTDVDKNEFQLVKNNALTVYNTLFVNEGFRFYDVIGKKPWDIIKINGQTAEELWGQKYAFLDEQLNHLQKGEMNDEEFADFVQGERERVRLEKETMYKVELLNEIVRGDSKITREIYVIDKADDSIKKNPDYPVALPKAELLKRRQFFKELETLKGDLKEIDARVKKSAVDNVSDATKESFARLQNAAKKLKDSTKGKSTYQDLLNAKEEFLDSVYEYYRIAEVEQKNLAPAKGQQPLGSRLENLRLQKESLGIAKIEEDFNKLAEASKGLENDLQKVPYIPDETNPTSLYALQSHTAEMFKLRFDKAMNLESDAPVYSGRFAFLNGANEWEGEDSYDLSQEESRFVKDNVNLDALGQDFLDMSNNGRRLNQNYSRRISAAGYTGGRNSSLTSVFLIWVIGHKNKSIEEAKNYTINPPTEEVLQLEKEFVEFLEKNPYRGGPDETEEQAIARIKPWLETWENTQHKIENYRLPEVDFADPKQIGPYTKELMVIRCMGGDGVQEWERLITAVSAGNAHEDAKFDLCRLGEKAVGKDQFWKTRNFYLDLQNFGQYVTDSHLFDTHSMNAQNLWSVAYNRTTAQDLFKKHGGKTLGEVLATESPRLHAGSLVKNKYQDALSEHDMEGDFNPAGAINFLLTGDGFTKDALSFHEKAVRTAREDSIISTQKEKLIKGIPASVLDNSFADRIMNVGDDAQAMYDLLNQTDEKGRLNKDVLYGDIRLNLLGAYTNYGILANTGLKDSDVFVLSGKFGDQEVENKTPEEIWGAKYAGIADDDPTMKQTLYFAEMIKAAHEGKQISAKVFKVNEEGNYEASDTVVVSKAMPVFDRIVAGYAMYEIQREELLSELIQAKENLQDTQNDKNANFVDGFEGSTEYKNYTAALKNAIEILSREKKDVLDVHKVSPDQIRRALQTLERTSEAYHNAKYSGFTYWMKSTDGRTRVEESDKTRRGLVDRFNTMRSHFTEKLGEGEKELLVDADGFNLNNIRANTLRNQVAAYRSHLKLTIPSDERIKYDYFKTRLQDKYEDLKERLASENKSYSANEKLAKDYLIAYFEERLAPETPGLEPLPIEVSDLRLMENFDKQITKLSKNPTFLREMKADRDRCIRDWHKAEKEQETKQTEFAKADVDATKRYGDLVNYVAGLEKPATLEDAKNELKNIARAMENNIQNQEGDVPEDQAVADMKREAAYQNLATVLIWQTMGGTYNEDLYYRQEISLHPERLQEMREKAVAFLKSKRALDTNANIDALKTNIDDYKYQKEYVKYLERERTASEKLAKDISRLQQNQNVSELSFLYRDEPGEDPDRTLTPGEKQSIKNVTIYDDNLNGALEKHSTAGRELLTNYFYAQVTEQREVVNDQGQNQTVEVQMPKIIPGDYDVYKKNADFSPAPERLNSVFIHFLLANGVGFEEAIRISDHIPQRENGQPVFDTESAWRAKFHQFVKDNPVSQESGASKEKIEESFKNWANIYKAGTDAMRQYRFPDEKLSNPEAFKRHVVKLVKISRLCVDVDQEYTRLFKNSANVTNGLRIAYETIGAKEYSNCKDFWWNLSGKINGVELAALQSYFPYDDTKQNIKNSILTRSVLLLYGMKQLDSLAGKTLNDAVLMGDAKAFYAKNIPSTIQQIQVYNAPINMNEADVDPELYPQIESAVRFLAGETEQFEKACAKLLAASEKQAQENFKNDQIKENLGNYNRFNINDPVFGGLRTVPDNDPDAMIAFLNNPVAQGEAKTGLEWLNEVASGDDNLFSDTKNMLANRLNMPVSNFYLIDGKNPYEIWGEKYEHIQDPFLKENLYRLEIVKECCLARHEIRVRVYDVEDTKLVEQPSVKMLPNRNRMLEIAHGVHTYEVGRKNFLAELNHIGHTLRMTQNDFDANFEPGANREIAVEGDADYRKMTTALLALIEKFEGETKGNSDIRPDDIRNAMDDLVKAAKTYDENHPASSATSDEAKTRRDVSRLIQEAVPKMKDRFDNLRRGFADDNLIFSGLVPFSGNSSFVRIKLQVRNWEEVQNLETLAPVDYEKKFAKDIILREAASINAAPIPTGKDAAVYNAAKQFALHEIVNKAENDLATPEDLRKLDQAPEIIERCYNDPVFKQIANKRPEYINRFGAVDKNADVLRVDIEDNLVNILQNNKSYAVYVTGIDVPDNMGEDSLAQAKADAIGVINRAQQDNRIGYEGRTRAEMYDRMSEVLSMQILSRDDKFAKEFREYLTLDELIAADMARENKPEEEVRTARQKNAKEFQGRINLILRAGKVLEKGGFFESDKFSKMLDKLEDGSLADEVMVAYNAIAKRDLENEARQTLENNLQQEVNREVHYEENDLNAPENQIHNEEENIGGHEEENEREINLEDPDNPIVNNIIQNQGQPNPLLNPQPNPQLNLQPNQQLLDDIRPVAEADNISVLDENDATDIINNEEVNPVIDDMIITDHNPLEFKKNKYLSEAENTYKPALQEMGKGIKKDHRMWDEKVTAFIKVATAHEIKKNGWTLENEDQSTKSFEKKVFKDDAQSLKALKLILERCDGNTLIRLVETNSLQPAMNKVKAEMNKPNINNGPQHEAGGMGPK